jgi:hypothetical protein
MAKANKAEAVSHQDLYYPMLPNGDHRAKFTREEDPRSDIDSMCMVELIDFLETN